MSGAPRPAAARPRAGMRPWYRFCRLLCQFAFLLLFRGRVFNSERVPRSGGVLLVCNHQSFLDPVLATLALPRECHYMARDTLFANPLFKRLCESLNAFGVKRGTADLAAIKESLRRLRDGALLTVFPEATRTHDGGIRPMQAGVVLLARKSGVPVVPALVLGAYEVWPRQNKLPWPGPIIVAYGEPLTPAEMSGQSDEACMILLRERILALHAHFSVHPAYAEQPGRARGSPTAAESELRPTRPRICA